MPPPGDLPEPGIDPTSLTSPALAGGSLPLVPQQLPASTTLSLLALSDFQHLNNQFPELHSSLLKDFA